MVMPSVKRDATMPVQSMSPTHDTRGTCVGSRSDDVMPGIANVLAGAHCPSDSDMIKGTLATSPLPNWLAPVATQVPAATHETEVSELSFVESRYAVSEVIGPRCPLLRVASKGVIRPDAVSYRPTSMHHEVVGHESARGPRVVTSSPSSEGEKKWGEPHFPPCHVWANCSCEVAETSSSPMITQKFFEGHCRAVTPKSECGSDPERGIGCGDDHSGPFWVIMKLEERAVSAPVVVEEWLPTATHEPGAGHATALISELEPLVTAGPTF